MREFVSTFDAPMFASRIEAFQGSVFGYIPGLTEPWKARHILVVINQNLEATAYIDELQQIAQVKVGVSIKPGEAVLANHIEEMATLDLGVEIPTDCAFVFLTTMGWQRSLSYDLGPLVNPQEPRQFDVKTLFAQQFFDLIKSSRGLPRLARFEEMRGALLELKMMLEDKIADESRYQEFLEKNPWILRGQHGKIERHTKLDDENIPDFTGIRHHDGFRDIIELKHPFLSLFKKDDSFSLIFYEAWDQAERYLNFVDRSRAYLADQKNLRFENARCYLIAGFGLSEEQLKKLQAKQSTNPSIIVLTYENLHAIGTALLDLMAGPS